MSGEQDPSYECLQKRLRIMTQALIDIRGCNESDLAEYCRAVDSIACEAITRAVDED